MKGLIIKAISLFPVQTLLYSIMFGGFFMDHTYLTIGQMAALNHISAQTLRLYDREGLLKPEYQDPANGYRYYHIDQCAQLDMIHTCLLYTSTVIIAASAAHKYFFFIILLLHFLDRFHDSSAFCC